MNKQPKLWEVLSAFLPLFIGITAWVWNLSTKVERYSTKIEYIEYNQAEYKKEQAEYKKDIKEINEKLETILIKLENKQDRKPQQFDTKGF